jgi:Tfp pilus assembly ATPase PilU
MQLMDDALAKLFTDGVITAEEAIYRAENKPQMRQLCGVS